MVVAARCATSRWRSARALSPFVVKSRDFRDLTSDIGLGDDDADYLSRSESVVALLFAHEPELGRS